MIQMIETGVTVATFVVASLVFFEAKRIRKVEGIFRQNQAWNEFGNAIAQFHQGTRIDAILRGKDKASESALPETADELTLVETFLLMSMFNVVSSEYSAACAKAIDDKYVIHSMRMTQGILKRNRAWIFDFLKENGYEFSFIQCLGIVERAGPDASELELALRAEFRANSRLLKRATHSAKPMP